MRFKSLILPIFGILIPIFANATPQWLWTDMNALLVGRPRTVNNITYTLREVISNNQTDTYLVSNDHKGNIWEKHLWSQDSAGNYLGDYRCGQIGFIDTDKIYLACDGLTQFRFAQIRIVDTSNGREKIQPLDLGNNQYFKVVGYLRPPIINAGNNYTAVVSVFNTGAPEELFDLDFANDVAVSRNANGTAAPSVPVPVLAAGTFSWHWSSIIPLQAGGKIQQHGWDFTMSKKTHYRNPNNNFTDIDVEHILHAENSIGVKWERTLYTEYIDPSGQSEITSSHHCKELGFIDMNRIFMACDGTDNNPDAKIQIIDLVTGGDIKDIPFSGLRNFDVGGYLRVIPQVGYYFPLKRNGGVVALNNVGNGSMQANVHFDLDVFAETATQHQNGLVPAQQQAQAPAPAPAPAPIANAGPFEIRINQKGEGAAAQTRVVKTNGQEEFWAVELVGAPGSGQQSLFQNKDFAFVATVREKSRGSGYGIFYQIDLLTGEVVHEAYTMVRDNDLPLRVEVVNGNVHVDFGIGGTLDVPAWTPGTPCVRFLHYQKPKN